MKTKLLPIFFSYFIIISNIAQAEEIDRDLVACHKLNKAVCDMFWKYTTKEGEDYCSFKGKRGEYTIPQGTIGMWGDPRTFGWILKKDYIGKRDYWCK